MLKAVLFDWGDTLMEFVYSPELVAAGHRAGLAAIGQDDRPELTEHFREEYEPLFWAPGTIDEIEYPRIGQGVPGDEAARLRAPLRRERESHDFASAPERVSEGELHLGTAG